MIRKTGILTLIMLAFVQGAFADVNGDLNNFFNSLGYSSNVTKPHAYQGQAAGYYSGGSLYLRAPVRSIQFAHIDAPRLDAGCGGIDIFTGGFSFINGKQLEAFGKNIMSNAIPYFADLALTTWAPQINEEKSKFQDWAQKFNANSMSTCQAAQDLVGGLWPKHTAAQRQICRDLGTQQGVFSDWASARQGCGTEADSNINNIANSAQGKKEITRNMNVIWQQLLSQSFLQGDTSLAEFFMSLSGTVVFDKDGNPTIFPTLLTNTQNINALMNGGTAELYTCDTTSSSGCLNLTVGNVNIDSSDALVSRVASMLEDLQQAYANDTAPTEEQESFLQKTSLPILKIIEVDLETQHSVDTTDLATLVAQDLLVQYLNDALRVTHESLINSGHQDSIMKVQGSINKAQSVINQMKVNINQRLAATQTVINQSLATQKMVMAELSSRLKTAVQF